MTYLLLLTSMLIQRHGHPRSDILCAQWDFVPNTLALDPCWTRPIGSRPPFRYPLAQQSCGGDIGSVPYVHMYVRKYVRMFTFCHRSSDLSYYPVSI